MTDRLLRIDSHDETTTSLVGEIVAEVTDRPVVITLEGELGAGKTRFARGLARGCGIDPDEISSPTFVVHVEHVAPGGGVLSHLDAYRLGGREELCAIGFDELLADPERIVAIEWASRIAESLPAERIDIRLDHAAEDQRRITVLDRRGDARARDRLADALTARAAAFSTPLGTERTCPTCDHPLPDDDHRPFCSSRCRLADLERWFQGEYSISRPVEERDLADDGIL